MWGTGLRLKFFLLSLLTLVFTSLCITFLLAYFYQSERLAFIDDQVRETATAIVDSELSDLKTYDYQIANALISEELGPDRVGKFFIVRNSKDEILFQTDNVSLLDVAIPRSPQWVTIEQDGRLLRVLNLSLPKFPNRTLQVGAITDSNFIFWSTLTQRSVVLISLIVGIVLVMTWFLSAQLFSPVRDLEGFLHEASAMLESKKDIPEIPHRLLSPPIKYLRRRDEFKSLVEGISQLVGRVNMNNKFTKSWTFQMVHEIKTPLTLLNRELERLQEKYHWEASENHEVQRQLNRVSRTITNFLDWADLANAEKPQNLHVLKTQAVVREVCSSIQRAYPDRLNLDLQADFQVMCNPLHLEQVIENLTVNALRYTNGPVKVILKQNQFIVQDQGDGVPAEVIERLGTPFNRGPHRSGQEKGSGLGLAWVFSVATLYGWKFTLINDQGTRARIEFPALDEAD